MSTTNEHSLEDDHHPDRYHHDHSSNHNNPLIQAKQGAWGDSISFLSNEHIRFVFQNVNGLSTSPGIHESMKSQMVALQGTMSAFAETNINWKNFTFRDSWETLLQHSYTTLQFSHSSCDEGHHRALQHGGTSMVCNHWLGANLLEKGGDISLGRWSWMKF